MTVEPAPEDRAFRCSVGATDEPMAGSAAVAATYLLVEHAGPWGRKALAESRFAEEVRHGLAEAAAAAGVRVQLIRRPGRSAGGDALRVFATYADPAAPWIATALLSAPEELLDLDLAALAAGSRAGLAPHDAPLYLVCTNGRRDLCCAEKGRPIVTALAAAYPDETWETTHVGGHRFAGAMLVLPHGLSYGRLDCRHRPRGRRAVPGRRAGPRTPARPLGVRRRRPGRRDHRPPNASATPASTRSPSWQCRPRRVPRPSMCGSPTSGAR